MHTPSTYQPSYYFIAVNTTWVTWVQRWFRTHQNLQAFLLLVGSRIASLVPEACWLGKLSRGSRYPWAWSDPLGFSGVCLRTLMSPLLLDPLTPASWTGEARRVGVTGRVRPPGGCCYSRLLDHPCLSVEWLVAWGFDRLGLAGLPGERWLWVGWSGVGYWTLEGWAGCPARGGTIGCQNRPIGWWWEKLDRGWTSAWGVLLQVQRVTQNWDPRGHSRCLDPVWVT